MNNPPALIRQTKWMALATCFLAVLFWTFFSVTKHDLTLAKVGVFIEDPFDAVGSFGVQLAAFAALLSLMRIFRPRAAGKIHPDWLAVIFRGCVLSLASIGVTLVADGIALLRYLPRSTGSPAGWLLTTLVIGFLTLVILAGWWVIRLGRTLDLFSRERPAWIIWASFLAAGLILFFYPDSWQTGVLGGISTALLGMVLLFAVTFAIMRLFFLAPEKPSEDLLDDLKAIYEWVKSRARFAGVLFRWGEAIVCTNWFRVLARWLNPRNHPWNLLVLVALGMGILLLVFEMTAEGLPSLSVFLLVFGVYVGIEGTGVLLGYALFNRWLGIIE